MYKVNNQKLTEVARRYDLDLVIVFGSQAQGQARPGSDIDVAVRWIRRDWEDVEGELALIGELTEAIWGDGDIDVSFLNGASPLLLFEVACSGVPLYERQPGGFTLFQSYAARRYYDQSKFADLQGKYLKERYASWTIDKHG
jgi:predicted nucleotidyltransferase